MNAIETATANLVAAQDAYAELIKIYRAAQVAFDRSRSAKNRAALIAASAACDVIDFARLHTAVDVAYEIFAAETAAAAAAAEAALQPDLFA